MKQNTTTDKAVRQVSQYDKIFKENIETVLPLLLEKVLFIQPVLTEEIPDDLQQTIERKPDFLKKITDQHQQIFILQIEFQLADDENMVYRMNEYYAMLLRKYKLPVRQFVFFIGQTSPLMPVSLAVENLSFRFNLITFNTLDYHLFTESDKPEEILLALLGDFGNDSPEIVVKTIIERLAKNSPQNLMFDKYLQQLRILANLRNLQTLTQELMESITKYFKEENDFLYLKGKQDIIINLLKETDFSLEVIASLASVEIDFVKQIKEKYSEKK
jgi:hypothetical protein